MRAQPHTTPASPPAPPASGSPTLAGGLAALLMVGHLLAAPSALAQSGQGSGTPTSPEPVPALEQRTERIVHEDAGSRIEELRVGGQTRTISVQTNTDVPGYQVQPLDAGRTDGTLGQRSGNGGRSTWRLFNF